MNADIGNLIADALSKLYKNCNLPIQLHEPLFEGNETNYIANSINQGWVSTAGSQIEECEELIKSKIGASSVFLTNTGTAALHLALLAAGVKAEDEVLVQSFTFIATVNAISYCKAIPNFVDINEESLGIDPDKLRDYLLNISKSTKLGLINKATGRRISCIIVMHTFGHESQVKDIQQIANEFNLKIIDDAAEAFGSYSGEKHVGINSDYSVFSFNGNKIVTSGGGGAFISRDPAITEQVRSLGSTARKKHPWEISHNEIGYNYRMPNLNAALLKAQIEKIELKVQRKRKIAEIYFEFLANFDEFHVYKERKGLVSNYWLNNLVLKTGNPDELSQILASLHAKGIYARPSWEPIHSSRPYKGCPRMKLDKTNSLSKRIISLPSSEKLEGQMSLNFFKSYAYLRAK